MKPMDGAELQAQMRQMETRQAMMLYLLNRGVKAFERIAFVMQKAEERQNPALVAELATLREKQAMQQTAAAQKSGANGQEPELDLVFP